MVLVYLDGTIRTTFEKKRWALPAQVFARPLNLYSGKLLPLSALELEMKSLSYRRVDRVRDSGQYSVHSGEVEVFSRGFQFSDGVEAPRHLSFGVVNDRLQNLQSRRNGTRSKLELVRLEPAKIGGIYPRHGEDRLLVKLDHVPPTLLNGLVAVEDQRFYSHIGISLAGIIRAFLVNVREGAMVQGGSTLTQQLIKNYYLTRDKTLLRKGIEALMAVLLEIHFDKGEILQAYLNEVYLGQEGPRAIHGFGLASQHYFGLPINEIGLHQQALLVGMVKGPSYYNPRRNPDQARQRRNLVLDIMLSEGVINETENAVASAMPLGLNGTSKKKTTVYPAFIDLVRRQLRLEYKEEDLSTLGLRIFTTFDPLVHDHAAASVERVMSGIDPKEKLEIAMVVTAVDSGEVKAVIGGRQTQYAGFNRALDAVRPVGSLFKPAIFLAALEQPNLYTLATPISDEPYAVDDGAGRSWEPRNFDRKSHGEVLLHRALAQSYNQATARLGMELGLESVINMLHRLGVDRELPPLPSLLLGSAGLSTMDVTGMYQTIAAGGYRLPLRSITDVVDAEGKLLKRFPLRYDRAVSVESMHLLHYAMQEVMHEGTGRGAYRVLPKEFSVAGKTGTTNDLRDSWFAGFSGDFLAVTWIGRDDNGPTGLTGSSGALRVWADFMYSASSRPLAYRVPSDISHEWIDSETGRRSEESCGNSRLLPFVKGSAPTLRTECAEKKNNKTTIKSWFKDLFKW